MDYADPRWHPIMHLEGVTSWQPGRTHGYEGLAAAMAFEDRLAGARDTPRAS